MTSRTECLLFEMIPWVPQLERDLWTRNFQNVTKQPLGISNMNKEIYVRKRFIGGLLHTNLYSLSYITLVNKRGGDRKKGFLLYILIY